MSVVNFYDYSDSDSSDDEFFMAYITNRKRKVFKSRIDNYNLWEEDEFLARYRISKDVARFLARLLESDLKAPTEKNLVITPADQILMALQYYASGSFYRCVGDMSGLHKSSVCRIVHRVSRALALRRESFIKMPTTESEKLEEAKMFYDIAKFPKAIGALDCTHIPTVSPGGRFAEEHRNRKGYFSINVQVVSDAQLCIKNIVARWPGAAHDNHIFNSSQLKTRLEADEFAGYWLISDKGYAIKPYLLVPLACPVTRAETLYNESQIRTRNVVERLFGLWKKRFPAIGTKLRVQLHRIQPIIIATAILHNICRKWNIPQPPDFLEIREEIEAEEVSYTSTEDTINRDNLIQGYFQRLSQQ